MSCPITGCIPRLYPSLSEDSQPGTIILDVLPEEIMIQIFGNLEVADLLTVGRVCRAWDFFHKVNELWEPLVLRDFHDFEDGSGEKIESFGPLIQKYPRIAYHTFSMYQRRRFHETSSHLTLTQSTPEGVPPNGFGALPVEVRMNIYGYLGVKDSIEAGRVCKEWNVVLKDNQLWKSLLLRDFHDFKGKCGGAIIEIFGSLVNEDAQLVYQICHLYKKCFLTQSDFNYRRDMHPITGISSC